MANLSLPQCMDLLLLSSLHTIYYSNLGRFALYMYNLKPFRVYVARLVNACNNHVTSAERSRGLFGRCGLVTRLASCTSYDTMAEGTQPREEFLDPTGVREIGLEGAKYMVLASALKLTPVTRISGTEIRSPY